MRYRNKNVIQPEGNYYDKYHSKNPIIRLLMNGYFKSLNKMFNMLDKSKRGFEILEAGCGEGNIANYVYQDFLESDLEIYLTAFDISEKVISEAKMEYPEIDFYVHNIYLLMKSNKYYDLIICGEVLEHLQNPEKAVDNLRKYSKYFLFSVPNEPAWRFLNLLRGKYIRDFGNTPGHIQHFSKNSLCSMLKSCGLTIVKMDTPLPWIMVLAKY